MFVAGALCKVALNRLHDAQISDPMSRRAFMEKTGIMVGGVVASATVLVDPMLAAPTQPCVPSEMKRLENDLKTMRERAGADPDLSHRLQRLEMRLQDLQKASVTRR